MLRSVDRWRFALEPRVVDEPGSNWNYSGGCTELLGAIVRKATGGPIEKFARDALFAPLASRMQRGTDTPTAYLVRPVGSACAHAILQKLVNSCCSADSGTASRSCPCNESSKSLRDHELDPQIGNLFLRLSMVVWSIADQPARNCVGFRRRPWWATIVHCARTRSDLRHHRRPLHRHDAKLGAARDLQSLCPVRSATIAATAH